MSLLKWVKKVAESALDPDRELRVQQLVQLIVIGLNQQKQNFRLENVQLGDQFANADLRDAADIIFKRTLDDCWKDNVISNKEAAKIRFAQEKLQISPDQAKNLTAEYANEAFAEVLANALEDGVIDLREQAHLKNIAAQVGQTAKEYARQFFSDESEGFLRAFFLASVEDGKLSEVEWNNLVANAISLGISKDELLQLIRRPGHSFVEHVLADAKSDSKITASEEKHLLWLIDILDLPKWTKDYVTGEIAKIHTIERLEDGILPVIQTPAELETQAEETVHLFIGCSLSYTKQLSAGPKTTVHEGKLAVTDRRMVFNSLTKSVRFSYRSILGHEGNELLIAIQVSNKPRLVFKFNEPNELAYPIFETCAGLANQTKIAKRPKRSRHIPREVRQVVWQRYAGRCADCDANDYLEFDHIIPVSKGGSNSASNVQLLCRRCNLNKSDNL